MIQLKKEKLENNSATKQLFKDLEKEDMSKAKEKAMESLNKCLCFKDCFINSEVEEAINTALQEQAKENIEDFEACLNNEVKGKDVGEEATLLYFAMMDYIGKLKEKYGVKGEKK